MLLMPAVEGLLVDTADAKRLAEYCPVKNKILLLIQRGRVCFSPHFSRVGGFNCRHYLWKRLQLLVLAHTVKEMQWHLLSWSLITLPRSQVSSPLCCCCGYYIGNGHIYYSSFHVVVPVRHAADPKLLLLLIPAMIIVSINSLTDIPHPQRCGSVST